MMPYRIQLTTVPTASQSGSSAVTTSSNERNEKINSMMITMAIKVTPKSVSARSHERVGSACALSRERRALRIAPRRTSERPTNPLRKKTGRLLPSASRSACSSAAGSRTTMVRMPSSTPKPALKEVATCPYSNPVCARASRTRSAARDQ